jgi:hypothetical protein
MRKVAAAALLCACSMPPDPTIPPRDPTALPGPAATSCFPPYSKFAQDWFLFGDMDVGASCRVYMEQDECILGIFRDCTDPNEADPRQWVGRISTMGAVDSLEFAIFPGLGSSAPRAPKCCEGDLAGGDWARLDCKVTSCGNTADQVHVGAYFEREGLVPPWGTVAERFEIGTGEPLVDLAVLSMSREIWVLTPTRLYVQPLPGTAIALPIAFADGKRIVAAAHEGTVFVAAGSRLLSIDTRTRTTSAMTDLGDPIDSLEISDDLGLLVGARSVQQTRLSLRRTADIETVTGEVLLERTAAAVPIPAPTASAAFVAALDAGGLVILTSTLAVRDPDDDPIPTEKPGRALFSIEGSTVGFFAGCSELSNAAHCYFEIDLAGAGPPRRLGLLGAGALTAALRDPDRDQVLLSGDGGSLSVVDRDGWRPLLGARVEIGNATRLARDGASGDLFALIDGSAVVRIQRAP